MYKDLHSIICDSSLVASDELLNLGLAINLIKIRNMNCLIYGVGEFCRVLIRALKTYDIVPQNIIDTDEMKAGMMIENIKVISLNQLDSVQNKHNTLVLVNISMFCDFELASISKMLILNGLTNFFRVESQLIQSTEWNFINYFIEHEKDLAYTYNMLEDEESKQTMLDYIRAVMQSDIYRGKVYPLNLKYWGKDENNHDMIYKHLSDEEWVNCGCCRGDTIFSYIENKYSFKKIYAVDGEKYFCNILKYNLSMIKDYYIGDIEIINKYIGSENEDSNFDTFFNNKRITLINMDIEGSELSVLKGAKNLIKKQRPVLAICVYHRKDDLVEIPKLIRECVSDYHFYLKKYPATPTLKLCHKQELILYAVPTERMV